MVLLSAQGMDVGQIAKVAFTSPDRVRPVIHNFNDDGFDRLDPKYSGGRPPKFALPPAAPDKEDRPQPAGRP
jgi:transposase